MNTELGRQKGDAKLSLFRDENGLAKFDLHFIRQLPRWDRNTGDTSWRRTCWTLEPDGQCRKLVDLVVDFRSKETKPCYLSKDPVTNEMFFLPADQARCPKKIKDYTLSQQEYADYTAGKEVPIEFKSSNGKILRTSIQMSAADAGPSSCGKKHEEAGEQTGAGTEGRLTGENAEA